MSKSLGALTSSSADWSGLRAPLLIESQAEYLRQQALASPGELSPRTALPGSL